MDNPPSLSFRVESSEAEEDILPKKKYGDREVRKRESLQDDLSDSFRKKIYLALIDEQFEFEVTNNDQDIEKSALAVLEHREGYWNSDRFMEQVAKAVM